MRVSIEADERYPVFEVSETVEEGDLVLDLAPELVERWRAADAEWVAVQAELRAARAAAVELERQRQRAEAAARRLAERGQRRPKRRPRPQERS